MKPIIPDVSAIKNAIVAVVAGVAGIGRVHNRVRLVTTIEQRNAIMRTAGDLKLHYWTVSLAGDEIYSWRRPNADIRFSIRGYREIEDEASSEAVFDGMVEDVIVALGTNPSFGGLVMNTGVISWLGPRHVELASVGCHHAEIIVPVTTNQC